MRISTIGLVLTLLGTSSAWAAPFAFVPNFHGESISVIDLASNAVVQTITEIAPRRPNAIAMHPDGHTIYVSITYNSAGAVDVYDTATYARTDIIDVGFRPSGLAVSPDGQRLYVAGFYSSDLAVVDTVTREVVARVAIGSGHIHVAVHPEGRRIYVADADSGVVSVVDAVGLTQLGDIDVSGGQAGAIAVSPDGTRLYVSLPGADKVAVVDTGTDTELATVNVGGSPRELAVSPSGARLYVSNSDDDTISVVDTSSNTAVATVAVGSGPRGVDVHPSGSRVYVASFGQDLVSVLDTATNTVINNILVGAGPIAAGTFITPSTRISALPDYHDFGLVDVGASAEHTFTVSNQGDAALVISTVSISWQDSGSFSIVGDGCSSQTLAAFGASCTLDLRFAPDLNGPEVAYLAVYSNDPQTPWLQLQAVGTGVAPDISIVSSVEPISARAIFFGNIPLGGSATETLTVINRGNAALAIGSIGAADPLAAPFSLAQDTCSSQTLAPEAACSIGVTFAPTTSGIAEDSFDLPSDDPDEGSISLQPRGYGSPDPVGNLLLADDLEPSDDLALPFGDVALGDAQSSQLILFNNGSAGALTVSAMTLTGLDAADFSFDPGDGSDRSCGPLPVTVPGPVNLAMPPQLQPLPCTIAVSFAPGSPGARAATLEVQSNDPDDPVLVLALSGRGIGPALAVVDAVDFGEVSSGALELRELAIGNAGTGTLTVAAIRLLGAPEFRLNPLAGSSPCGALQDLALTPGRDCTLLVEMTATSAGVYSGAVEIDSDDPRRPTASVPISGSAVDISADAGMAADASSPADARGAADVPDGGNQPRADAGSTADAGASGGGDDDGEAGCGCASAGAGAGWALLALIAGGLDRRRRPRTRAGAEPHRHARLC